MVPGLRKLIVNADDFGFTRDVNEGILHAHEHGIVRSASLLATGPAFQHAVELARATPSLDVGAHLALVGLPSALDGRPLPSTPFALLRAMASHRLDIHAELAAQMDRIVRAGIQPSHINTHKHTHLFPAVLKAVTRLARQYGVPWVRRPFDSAWPADPGAPLRLKLALRTAGPLRAHFDRVLARSGCRSTDHFAGLLATGRFDAAALVRFIRALPPGSTEFMCHPGRCGTELAQAPTRLKASRERELEALVSAAVLQAVAESDVELCNWRQL